MPESNTPYLVDTQQRVLKLSADILAEPPERIRFSCINDDFTWLKFGELVWARTEDFRAAMFWAVAGAEPRRLNGENSLEALSDILRIHTGPLPDGLSSVELGGAIRRLTIEPRAIVASQSFLQEVTPRIENWMKVDSKPDRDHFARQCSDPQLTQPGDRTWTLTFNVFNPDGGVEKWVATGDKARIKTAGSSVAVRNGTFIWPKA